MSLSLGSSLAAVKTLSVALALAAPYAFSQTSSAGSISGTVTGDDGKPVAAVITASRTGPPLARGRAEATSKGAFTITNLPAGTYMICAQVSGGGYLDPCAWSPDPPKIQIGAGQVVTGYRLVVKKGAVLQVRLNDTSKVLDLTAAPRTTAPHVLLGVFTTRRVFEPLHVTSKTANGRDYEGAIPVETPVSLYITGRKVRITNESGAEIGPAGSTVTVKRSSGGKPEVVTFNISSTDKP
jgi:hypothetical protein